MTATQQRTYDEQLAHEDALIDSWPHEEKDIIDLSDLDDDFEDFSRDYDEEDWSME